MSTFSSAYKTVHVPSSPSFKEHACDSVGLVLSQGGCLTHDQHQQMLGTELGLMEMSEVEYTHLQHLVQAHIEAQTAPLDGHDARSHPANVMVKDTNVSAEISPFTTSQAIDLSTSTDEHGLLMPGEKTPASYGEVPGFVLARVRGDDGPDEPHVNSSASSLQKVRSRSAARVCLEKRFNNMSSDTLRQQDIQSAVLSNFLSLLQQSAEAQEAAIHPQMQKWIKTDRRNSYEINNHFIGGVFNPATNVCEQAISHVPHMVEPKHQGLIVPKNFSLNFQPTKAHYTSGSSSVEEQHMGNTENDVATPATSRNHCNSHSPEAIVGAKTGPDAGESRGSSRKRARPHMSLSQRRERHNSKERERRKRIRSCCDELNMLVPFCHPDTDKVTTLQWTTAFLRYINKMYGDTFKEEFQKAFTDEKGVFLKSSLASGQDPILGEMDDTLSIPHAVEQ